MKPIIMKKLIIAAMLLIATISFSFETKQIVSFTGSASGSQHTLNWVIDNENYGFAFAIKYREAGKKNAPWITLIPDVIRYHNQGIPEFDETGTFTWTPPSFKKGVQYALVHCVDNASPSDPVYPNPECSWSYVILN